MNVVLHIVRKDLLRLRWLLVAWIGVLLLPVLMGLHVLAHNPLGDEHWTAPQIYTGCLVLEGLAAYLLTLLLIQEDPLVGTRQFWLTRPIGRRQLLRAKVAGAGVILGVIPILVSLPWWLWCGFGVREIGVAAFELCLLATLVALPAALVAVLTDSVARALLWTLVAFAGVSVGILIFSVGILSIHADQPVVSLWISRYVLAIGLVAIELAILVVMQYRRNRSGPWLVGAVAGVVTTLFAASHWPWGLVGRTQPGEVNGSQTANIAVRLRGASADPASVWGLGGLIGRDPPLRIMVNFSASGIPAGLGLVGIRGEERWLVENKYTLRWTDQLYGRTESWTCFFGSRIYEWQHRQNLPRVPAGTPEGEVKLWMSAYFRPSVVARLQSAPPRYNARLWMELVRAEVGVRAALAPGRWRTHGGEGMRIESVRFDGEELSGERPATGALITLVESRPAALGSFLRSKAEEGAWFVRRHRMRDMHVLLSDSRSEFLWFTTTNQAPRELVINGVRVRWVTKSVEAPHVIRNGKWTPVPSWISDATIGAVNLRSVGVFSRDVATDRFEAKSSAKP